MWLASFLINWIFQLKFNAKFADDLNNIEDHLEFSWRDIRAYSSSTSEYYKISVNQCPPWFSDFWAKVFRFQIQIAFTGAGYDATEIWILQLGKKLSGYIFREELSHQLAFGWWNFG
jgi:hypothetical protein